MLEIKQVYEHFAGARSSDWSLKASAKPSAVWGSLALDVNQRNKDKQLREYNSLWLDNLPVQCSAVSSVVRKPSAFTSCSLRAHIAKIFPSKIISKQEAVRCGRRAAGRLARDSLAAKPWPGRGAVSQVAGVENMGLAFDGHGELET